MLVPIAFLLACGLCLAIRVPNSWGESASEVNQDEFSIEQFKPINSNNKPIPAEYFEYTAKKPQFAIDVAKFHGVQSPENHYEAYPIKPHTGKARPELGKHRILDKENAQYRPLQEFANINEDAVTHAVPVSSNYEVFHPYEAETPALQEIYKDPILNKIRSDLENSKNRLQAYEKEAGEPDIDKDEYLESPQKTDSKFGPQRNIPAPYEIHRPQRRPVYYRPALRPPYREYQLNQRLRHPWNQYSAKIRPVHYKPIRNHIHHLRQNHALKYDDERNEYPQVQILENYSDPKDGYDIYERGKDKFVQLRNNVDESINKAVQDNRPATYEKLEVQNNDDSNTDEEEFVPIKNYAQVRKTETYRHLPRSAAFADADTLDEIRNAPRLREAVKSTKAQTVYSEEGYEDSAYDHAGEQKHASENEGHGGFLKQHELSGGKYKTPSESAKYQDGGGSAFRDAVVHAEKWKEDNKDNQEVNGEEDYSEDENEKSIEGDEYNDSSNEDGNPRNKREYDVKNDTITESSDAILLDKSNTSTNYSDYKNHANFKVPELDLKSTFLTEQEILDLAKIQLLPKKDTTKQKYPYYYEKIRAISEHSPLRYAENLKSIPRKSNGGTEFYDSRSIFECPEVDDIPDPVPEKLKGDGHPDEDDSDEDSSKKGDENFDTAKKTPRLKGLGDKIDCFKAKYFGENPLDSPFFTEELIPNPEPVTPPNKLGLHHFKSTTIRKEPIKAESKLVIIENNIDKEKKPDLFELIDKLRKEKIIPLENINVTNNTSIIKQQSPVYSDILESIKNNYTLHRKNINEDLVNSKNINNVTYISFKNKEDVTKPPSVLRRKRSTPFIYEPYKIIREGQLQDSKKTTTTNNISPLIRQLQSSRVVDKVTNNQDGGTSEKHVKRNINTRTYKDIGKKDREGSKNDKDTVDPAFVDVNVDKRRGEPRYEIIRHRNHKPTYTPVDNKKSMSVEDYKAQTDGDNSRLKGEQTSTRRQSRQNTINRPSTDIQNIAESSNTVRKTISTTVRPSKSAENEEEIGSDGDYEEYDEDEEEEEDVVTTTTTTAKPSFRRKRPQTTTEQTPVFTERPKLRLVTRFRDYKQEENSSKEASSTQKSTNRKVETAEITELPPKYREKKKKSSKSTLVTDTKRYGDDDEDMRKEDIDALIGVKQNMNDYMPLYEKEEKHKLRNKNRDEVEEDDNEDEDDERDTIDDDDDEDDDDIDDDDGSDEDEDEEEDESVEQQEPEVTTSEPTKRTLAITTDAPSPTIATRNTKLEAKPIVTKKKIEIHKELPANKSSPHTSQYRQDIKEVEIIKEIPVTPKKKKNKNLEALELYRDDNLAKDINQLGGVEIFKEDVDLKKGPRHGGNYKLLEEPDNPAPLREKAKEDTVASQSEFTKHVELEEDSKSKLHGGNLKSLGDVQKSRSRGRSEKLIELTETPPKLHGGNLKRGRNRGKSEKLIELDESHENNEEEDSRESHESYNSRRPMHGGNYRSARLEQHQNPDEGDEKSKERGARRNAAAILNSFVQAAPILTTPAYIVDPSKRMYYYVDV